MDLRTSQKIWNGYKTYAKGASVIRRGYENVGAANTIDDSLNYRSTFIRRSESILEHQAKTAWLASVFASNCPTYFGQDYPILPSSMFWMLFVTELCHDVGELEHGDIPDNGSRQHEIKDQEELSVFRSFVEVYNSIDQNEILALYKTFQDKDSYLGQALFALDKCEAVLTHLLLEDNGLYGNLSANPHPTQQECYYSIVTGSKFAADTWGYQMKDQIESYPLSITQPIFMLLATASREVRGKPFTWLPPASLLQQP